MNPIQFSGLYRISGDNQVAIFMKAAQIQLMEPFKAAARDGKDVVLLTQKDAANFMEYEFNIETPADIAEWTPADWVNPANWEKGLTFAKEVAEKLKNLSLTEKIGMKDIEKHVVKYFKVLETHKVNDASGKEIQYINV